jgi:uncharacterized protein YmfQ (DUF2313 family)
MTDALDKYKKRTGEDYAEAFAKLLPFGIAWPRHRSSVLMRTVYGLCSFWGYIEDRASTLLERESDPRATTELLPDWERNFGLPDPCYAEPFSIGDRQKALVQRMTIQGAQSREFFISVASQIGYTISISEYRPFMCGIDRCGDNRVIGDGTGTDKYYYGGPALNPAGKPLALGEYSDWPYMLGPLTNRYYWKVHVGTTRLTWFRVGGGGGQVGIDPHLRIGLATDLECLLNRWKPAHTQIIFDYSGVTVGGAMAGTP